MTQGVCPMPRINHAFDYLLNFKVLGRINKDGQFIRTDRSTPPDKTVADPEVEPSSVIEPE
jgi:hypothetical protein